MNDKSLLRQVMNARQSNAVQDTTNDKSLLRRSLEAKDNIAKGIVPQPTAVTSQPVRLPSMVQQDALAINRNRSRFGMPQLENPVGLKEYAPVTLESLAGGTPAPEAPAYVSPFANNEDYAELSRYKSTKNSEEIDNRNFLDKAIDWIIGAKDNEESKKYNSVTGYTTKDYDDELYEYINRNPDVVSRINTNEATSGQYFSGVDQSFLQEMEDAEIADYNYLYATQGKDKANEFLQNLKKDLTKRQMDKYVAENQQYARENPVAASAWSVLAKPLEGVSLAGQLMDYKLDRDMDQNAGYNRFVKQNQTIRQTVPENWSKVGQFLYGTGMSIVDNLYNMALTGAFGNVGGLGEGAQSLILGIMGSSAAAESTLNALEEGYSADRAMLQGAIAGGIEVLTEKISLETLLSPNAFKDGTIKYLLKNAAAEGSEEGASTVANWVVDWIGDLITDENRSDFRQVFTAFKRGDTKEGWRKIGEMGLDLALDVAGGALSGGVLAGGGSLINLAENTVAGRSANRNYSSGDILDYVKGSMADVQDNPYASDFQRNLANTAMEQYEQNGKVSNHTLGELMQSNAYLESEQAASNNLLGEAMEQINSGKTVSDSTVKEILDNKRAVDFLSRNSGLQLQDNMTRPERFQAVRNSLNQTIQQIDEVQAPARKVVSEIRQQNELYKQKSDMVSEFAKTLGEQGGRTLMRMADNEDLPNITSLADAYTKVYNEIKANPEVNLNEVSDEIDNRFTPQQLNTIYKSAVKDYEADLKKTGLSYEGETNAEETATGSQDSSTDGVGTVSLDSEVSTGSVAGRTAEVESRRKAADVRIESIRNNAALNSIAEVTSAEAGIPGGVNTDQAKTVRVLSESQWSALDTDTYNFLHELKDMGYEVKAWTGTALAYDEMSGKNAAVRGFIQDKTIGVRVDANLSARKIAYHEMFHDMVKTDSSLQADMVKKINEHYGEGKLETIVRDYVSQYGWTQASDEEILNDILADAYAGIDIYEDLEMNYEGATQVSADVRGFLNENGVKTRNGNNAGQFSRDSEGNDISPGQAEYFKDSKIRDEDGNLQIVYHGTDADFTVFDRTKGRSNMDIQGSFFSPWELDAAGYGGNVKAYYLNIKNPAPESVAYRALNRFKGQNNAGVKAREYLERLGYDGVNNGNEEYIAFYPEQIKEVENVNPTSDPDIRYSRDTTGMESELQKQNRELNRELKEVTERYHYFKDQLVLTKVRQATEKSANRVAKQLVKDYSSNVSADEIAKALREASKLVLNVKADTDIDELQTQLKDALRPYAMQMVTNVSELMNAKDVELQKSIRNDLRNGTGIIVTEQMKKDVPDWASFRKAQFGNMKLVSGPKTNIHDVYLELAQKYGEGYFPQDVSNKSDMLQVIADVMADLSAIYDNPYTYGGANIAEAIESCTNDMMMSVVGSLEAESPTFADKEKAKRDALRKQAIEAKNAALQRVREQRDDALAKQSARYKDRINSIYNKRQQYEYRGKIRKKAKDLSTLLLRPTDKKHIPYNLQGVVLDVLNSINTGSRFDLDVEGNRVPLGEGIQTKKTSAYLRLKEQLTQLKNQLVVDPDLFDTEDSVGMLTILSGVGDTSIDAMDTEQLEAVYTVLRNVENIVRTYNKAFNQARFDTISEAAVALHDENAGKTGRPEYIYPVEKTLNLLTVDMLTPEAYFRRLGTTGSSLFKMLRNAQDKNIRILKEAQEFTEANGLYKLKLKKYENDLLTVRFGNRDVNLSKAQLMELYVLNKREASRLHIQVGGIIPEPVQTKKSLKKNTYIEPVRNISQDDLARAFSQLSAEDIQIAERLQEFVSTVMTDYGNEASMKVYGYKKFGDENYWPIRVNEMDLRSELGAVRTRSRTVSNKGFTNALKPNANQSVSIGSIFDTFTEHVAEMANYSAFLDTMEDLKRIYNYTERGEGGSIDLSIKYDINNVFGNKGTKYFEKLMEDVSNGMISEQSYFGGLIGRFKAAAVGSNLRVIIQQPTAIFRAMDMISPKYMAIGIAKFRQGAKKALANSPIAQWKDWGYFDINTGRSTKNILFENSDALDRVQSVLMAGAGKADSLAWGALYSAVEAEIKDTRPDLDPRSKEFDRVVADRFADVIDHSQVVDGVLQRSGIMRSTNAIDKMATSFMGEPIKQFNMLASAIYNFRHAVGENKAQAGKVLARTTAAMVFAGVLNAAVQSIVDAIRDDDPEKDYWEKFLEKFTGEEDTLISFMSSNVGDFLNPAQYVPYAKDIVSIIQGYDVERMDISLINDLYTDAKSMVNSISGKGKYSTTNNIINFMNTASKFLGLSIGNVKRDVAGIANTIAQETGSYVFEYRMSKFTYNLNQATNKGRFVEILAKAYEAGDRQAFNIILNDLIKEDKFATTTMTTREWIKKRLKEKHQISIN